MAGNLAIKTHHPPLSSLELVGWLASYCCWVKMVWTAAAAGKISSILFSGKKKKAHHFFSVLFFELPALCHSA